MTSGFDEAAVLSKTLCTETFLVVQWLRICLPNAGDMGSVPSQETKIPHAMGQISLHAGTTEPTGHN